MTTNSSPKATIQILIYPIASIVQTPKVQATISNSTRNPRATFTVSKS